LEPSSSSSQHQRDIACKDKARLTPGGLDDGIKYGESVGQAGNHVEYSNCKMYWENKGRRGLDYINWTLGYQLMQQ
jgi:hypothetical protein